MNTNTKQPENCVKTDVSKSVLITGKCKEDFNFWIWEYANKKERQNISQQSFLDWFYNSDNIIQNAYCLEFFEVIGFHIGRDLVSNYWLENSTFFEKRGIDGYDSLTTLDSYEEAIKYANRLYNDIYV